MRVRCHCQPPRLVSLKPCLIQARKPYPAAVLATGGRSVTSNHRSVYPGSQQASIVQASGLVLNAAPRLCHWVSGAGANVASDRLP